MSDVFKDAPSAPAFALRLTPPSTPNASGSAKACPECGRAYRKRPRLPLPPSDPYLEALREQADRDIASILAATEIDPDLVARLEAVADHGDLLARMDAELKLP